MCVTRTGRWAESLRHTLRRVYDPTTRTPVPWLLSGDAALALQGVDVEPDMIEFRAISPFAAAYFAQFMKPYEVPANKATIIYRRGGNVPPSESWHSNVHQRIVAWSHAGRACWFGRWLVDGATVQVSYERSIYSDPVAQAVRPEAEVRRASFEGNLDVAVVPIEFLLAESAATNDTQFTRRILHAMRSCGYSTDLLRSALDLLPSEKASRLTRLLEFSLVAG